MDVARRATQEVTRLLKEYTLEEILVDGVGALIDINYPEPSSVLHAVCNRLVQKIAAGKCHEKFMKTTVQGYERDNSPPPP